MDSNVSHAESNLSNSLSRDSISREKALQWIARQWPQEEVRQRADFEIVNDGEADLEKQIERLLRSLNKKLRIKS